MNESYKQSGVDVHAGYRAVELMREHVGRTARPELLGGLGGFGGAFSIAKAKNMEEPVLVSGTDGVGTKLKIAFLTDKHDTIGVDAVAMCVNDIACMGAEPLFFLDYIACGKNVPERIAAIVKGVADGCVQAGCALVGGETAEMPGFYPEDEYDVAGFAVGIVDKKNIIDGSTVRAGDALIGISSSGLHSNGFSLVRKLLAPTHENVNEYVTELGMTLGEALLTPTKIYVKAVQNLMKRVKIKGIAHITGGGFIENIPRALGGLGAAVNLGSWDIHPIFSLLQSKGNIPQQDMFNTFNMGIGMVAIVSQEDVKTALSALENAGERAYIIGSVTDNSGQVEIC